MTQISPDLIGPIPTVLEIGGFTPEATQALAQLFRDCLQQPSYVSRATIRSTDAARRTPQVESMDLACPLGLGLRVHMNSGTVSVEELSPCCMGSVRSFTCQACHKPLATTPMATVWATPLADLPFDGPAEEDTRPASRMDELEQEILGSLERKDVETFSAFLIAGELRSLIFELARFNGRG